MRDITDFLLIGFITGVVVIFSILRGRKEQGEVESIPDTVSPRGIRKAS
jgi:hypothetical protein